MWICSDVNLPLYHLLFICSLFFSFSYFSFLAFIWVTQTCYKIYLELLVVFLDMLLCIVFLVLAPDIVIHTDMTSQLLALIVHHFV